MGEDNGRRALIMAADLERVAQLIESRGLDCTSEQERLAAASRVIGGAVALQRALEAYTRRAVVNHRGSPGNGSLAEASAALFDALNGYADDIREIMSRLRERDAHDSELVPL